MQVSREEATDQSLHRRFVPAVWAGHRLTGIAPDRLPSPPRSSFATIIAAVLVAGIAFLSTRLSAAESLEFLRFMNIGKAQLENRNSARAIEAFEAAIQLSPNSTPARRNLARAQMLAGQNEEALKPLGRARDLERESVATSYLTGLTRVHQGRFEEAIPPLEEAVRLDPRTAALRFQLANACEKAMHPEKALAQFRETVRLDPLHATAHFRLAAYARQSGDTTEYEREQQEFMRLRKLFSDDSRTPAALEKCLYTQPEAGPGPVMVARPASRIPVRFTEVTAEVLADHSAATAAAVLEVNDQGVCSVFVVDDHGAAGLLAWGPPGRFVRTSVEPSLTGRPIFHQCIAGNFFDDAPKGVKYDPAAHARNDIFLLGTNGCRLLQRIASTSFADVTDKAGLGQAKGRRAEWVDYDHDGDLDLLLATDSGLQLWQNNGDGHFTNVTEQVGLRTASPAWDLAPVDLDSNVAIDLVAAQGDQPTLVFMNQRAGRFARMPEPPGPWPAARRLIADDLDNDGSPDVLLVSTSEAVIMFGNRAGRQRFDLSATRNPTAALLDFDNDGWLDLCVAGQASDSQRGTIRLWQNGEGGAWSEVTQAAGMGSMSLPPIREVIPADFDADGDTDLLLLTEAGTLRFLRNDGGNAHAQLKVQLTGTKTNPTGIGARLEARAGDFRVTRSVSALPIEIGLGQRKRLDSLQTIWANGIVDNQIDLAVPVEPLKIVEKNVAAGSCPYLYAWSGHGFGFVTDLLGNSPLGLSMRRGAVLPADPTEIVRVGTEKELRLRRGAYELEVTEELREVLYLDQARMIALDHAPDVEVHSTDKLGPPPFPGSDLWALRWPRLPLRVTGDDGIDRTEAVRFIDGWFAPPGPLLPPPLRGFCQPLVLTIDFGGFDAERPLVLALTGWLQYGDASANIAASQNSALSVMPPRLEVETGSGIWQPVDATVGVPAGKTKTILCDLTGKLPRGARRLRLITTFEIRWDRIALFERAPAAELERHELAPSGARLRWRGFSEIKPRGPGGPQTPAYERLSERPPWRTTPEGWCTRYGDVLDLVKTRDERLVILNAGDALTLRFEAKGLPPVPKGRVRTFFFYSVGWDKDADYNVEAGDTVDPLPVRAAGTWAAEYNTRWVKRDRFAPSISSR